MGSSLWTIVMLCLCSLQTAHSVHMKSCVAQEGKEATIVCLVAKTEENKDLWWTVRDMSTGASTPLSKCPLTNFYQPLCEDEESARSKYSTEIFIHGDEFQIALKFPAVNAHHRQLKFTCKVHKTGSNISRDSETCSLLVIYPPDKPTCTAEHRHSKIHVTCRTDKVHPNLACQMVQKVTNEENVTTDVHTVMATVNKPIYHNGFLYYNGTCSASIDPGNSDVQVDMYPNGFPFEEVASVGAEFITKIQVSLPNVSQEANNDNDDKEATSTTNNTAIPEISSLNGTMHGNEKSDVNDREYNRTGTEEGKADAVLATPDCDNVKAALIAVSVLLTVCLLILAALVAWIIWKKCFNRESLQNVRLEGAHQQQQQQLRETRRLISSHPNASGHNGRSESSPGREPTVPYEN